MTVSTVSSESEVVVHVDGDLGSAATLVALHAQLNAIEFSTTQPVLVDVTAAVGDSAGIDRLLERTAKVMRHRGLGFTVVDRALVSA